ncbi:hypothetical protein QBC40DRAFT_346615 [Triangularia verruculosa]|uniref:2'-phosphotransferase n=1 Tax=Triangularia verruculosa TaxID=2587418 RepID=A0AAN6XQT1_9PEZI|nr:hypothetical protein QBC40DRAFT_346615 [Triangularia verruculosa]
MATAVAVPFSAINNELGGVLPPSALANNSARHGRSRGMSVKGRRYSVVEERDTTIAKALMFVIKRAIQREEAAEDEGETERGCLVADADGWIALSDVLAHSRIREHNTSLSDVRRIVSNAVKARFELREAPNTNSDDAESWQISRIGGRPQKASSPVSVGNKLTVDDTERPEFVIYETSYQRYSLLVILGGIARAPGGAEYHTFVPVSVDEEGNEIRPGQEAAEVSIWIHLESALQPEHKINWRKSDTGMIITSDEVPKSLWNKSVARRPDIGLLFEDGQVKKEIPAGLRGKAAKSKGKKGGRSGVAFRRDGSSDDSGSASELDE